MADNDALVPKEKQIGRW